MNENEEVDPIASLIRTAGRRPQPDPRQLAAMRAAVHAEWQSEVSRRRRTRWIAGIAAAAAIVIAVLLIRPHSTTIETAGTANTVDWNGNSLRVEPDARVTLASANVAVLERGTIYVDVKGPRVTIRTPFGDVHDVGTKFEVRLTDDDVNVRVDEGSVELRGTTAVAGERITATRTAIARNASPILLEGMRLDEALTRVARAKKLTLDWHASPARRAIVLHGDVPFTPDEALDAVTAASGVNVRIDGDRMVVEEAK
jgi:ferric-dicitrate binding protein FerR (iron transport regulator)